MAKKKPDDRSAEELLADILQHMENMDKRDRLRTWGSTLKGILSLIPMILFLYSAWYLYQHGDEVLSQIASEAAKQAAKVTQDSTNSLLEGIDLNQFQNFIAR